MLFKILLDFSTYVHIELKLQSPHYTLNKAEESSQSLAIVMLSQSHLVVKNFAFEVPSLFMLAF